MFQNYFKIALRNLTRNKIFSAINIAGLGIGIATCLAILLFIINELSYDRYNERADRMVAVSFQGVIQGQKMNEGTVMPPVAGAMKAEFPEVEAATRLRNYGTPKLVYGDNTFRGDAFAFVDSNFFQVFTLPLVEGNPNVALQQPNSVVISRALAHKYFGNEAPMGKVIRMKEGTNTAFKVTGVMEPVPANSNFHFDLFASMASLPESREPTWMSSNFHTYLVLRQKDDYKKLEAKLPSLVQKYIGPQMQQAMGITLADFRKNGNDLSFHLKPIAEIHLDPDFPNDLSVPGDRRTIYIFGAIAVFMLLIASINFMNLSTAGASRRLREVGVRKVLGSRRAELIRQFLLESVILSAIALVLALILIYLALPAFNRFSSQKLDLNFSDHPLLLPGLVLFILFTGILSGSYPALYLSSFEPAAVLKGKFVAAKKGLGLRSGLVVFQFFISLVLMISTAMVFKQLSFMQHKDVGYNKDQVMIIPDTWMLGKSQDVFYQELASDPRVVRVSRSGFLPAGASDNNNFFVAPEQHPEQLVKTLRYEVDENYIGTLGIHLLEGRNFSKAFGTDSTAVILNETAARAFGWGREAVGHLIFTSLKDGQKKAYHVIGIVKDFNFRSLHELISPLVMTLSPGQSTLIARLNTKDISGLTGLLAKRWTAFGAEDPFSFSFLDERFTATYKAEQRTGMLLGLFAGLTIFVACLGLFGLAMFTAQRRTKEIGIRKILGASVAQVTKMLSKDFLKLVLAACVLAFPLSYFIVQKWLQDFAYRTAISWWVFALAAVAGLLIAFLTVSAQAIKAATANPARSLRTE